MNELALFAGAGGGLLATKWLLNWRSVCYVEKDSYCVEVLKARIRDGYLDDAPIWDDVRTFDGRPWAGLVDVVSGGFPCQPWSSAGKVSGKKDSRNLWPETIRIIREVKPQWCFLENVPNLLAGTHGYFGQILKELAESGFDVRWCVLSARALGLYQRRSRLWIVANAGSFGRISPSFTAKQSLATYRKKQNERHRPRLKHSANDRTLWPVPDSGVWGVANGIPERVDEFRAIGNGQVPIVAATAWKLLTEEL